jgi:hypothetical protein
LLWQMYWMTCFFYCHIKYFTFSHHCASDVSFGIIKHLLAIDSDIKVLNREGDRLNYHPLPCDRLNWHTLLNQWDDRKFTWNIITQNNMCTMT